MQICYTVFDMLLHIPNIEAEYVIGGGVTFSLQRSCIRLSSGRLHIHIGSIKQAAVMWKPRTFSPLACVRQLNCECVAATEGELWVHSQPEALQSLNQMNHL